MTNVVNIYIRVVLKNVFDFDRVCINYCWNSYILNNLSRLSIYDNLC